MNFLQLCDQLVRETGVAEQGIASVTGQTGIKLKAVNWINQAWTEIQSSRKWNFLWKASTFNTVIGQNLYDPVENLALNPVLDSWSGVRYEGLELPCILWDNFSRVAPASGKPASYTIRPDNVLQFDALPDAVYAYSFEYYREPQVLVAGTDVPIIAAQHHQAIVYQAMLYLAAEQDAPEIQRDALYRLDRLMSAMRQPYLPKITIASAPLA